MSDDFDYERHRFGSSDFVTHGELRAAGMLEQTPDAAFLFFHEGQPVWGRGDGGIAVVVPARTGKLTDFVSFNACHSVLSGQSILGLDPRGEISAIAQDQTPDQKHVITWNPLGLNGLPTHRINPLGLLKASSPTLISDSKVAMENIIGRSGAAGSEFFELTAGRYGEAFCPILAKKNGVVTLPDLFDTVCLLQEGGTRWRDFAYLMYSSDIPNCRSVETEIAEARKDASGGFKGSIAELMKALAPLSDPLLRESVSPPFDFDLADLGSSDQLYQLTMICPPEMIEPWGCAIKSIFTTAMIQKSRKPSAPRQTWIIDEASQLKGFDLITRMFTFGAGSGIRPIAIFQNERQMRELSPNADSIITSCAAVRLYFGLRDLGSAQTVSNMLGAKTLDYFDPVQQGRADLERKLLLSAAMLGDDPFRTMAQLLQKDAEARHRPKQKRMLRMSDELLYAPPGRVYALIDGLSGPVQGERLRYWTVPWMAGRYHPNPLHPPLDRVQVQGRRGPEWRPVIREPVPEAFVDYPQYQDGLWSRIGETPL